MGVRSKLGFFVVVGAAAAGLMHMMAGGQWTREGQYVVARRGSEQVGSSDLVVRLHVYTRIGEPRDHFEVPREAFDVAAPDDELHVKIRRIPVLEGELFEYTLVRGTQVTFRWTEGAPFYFTALSVSAAAIALALTLLLHVVTVVFKLKAVADA